MPINREIDKDVAHIYSGILIRHKKKQNRAICKDVDRSRDDHTMWSKRKTNIWYHLLWKSFILSSFHSFSGPEKTNFPFPWKYLYHFPASDLYHFSMGFPDSSVVQESTCNAGDPSSIPGLWRFSGEGIGYPLQYSWASFVAQLVKNLHAMRETWVWSLGWEGLLEKGKAYHSSIVV